MIKKTGVLLINVGTPDELTLPSIKKYLAQFLWDERVLDIPPIQRWLLLRLFILPFRPRKTLEAYQAIWMKEGSPLLVYSNELKRKLQSMLGDKFIVELGMCVGNPSIKEAFNNNQAVDRWLVMPLFPQYAAATTASALSLVFQSLINKWDIPSITTLSPFYNRPEFIALVAKRLAPVVKKDTHILFSYHSLPERHLTKSGCTGLKDKRCEDKNCQTIESGKSEFCYRKQCVETTKQIAQTLNLSSLQYSISFQSRLGSVPWIGPSTEEAIKRIYAQGVRSLAVVCPSFVTDCLESLEEIGIRLKEEWLKLGGESFTLVPCLNADGDWAAVLRDWVLNINP